MFTSNSETNPTFTVLLDWVKNNFDKSFIRMLMILLKIACLILLYQGLCVH